MNNINLGKNVIISSFTRPIKIAYIIPYDETQENQWLLDAIFYESYTRWAGTKTLIIPSNKDKFLYPEYEGWLALYDADFVYSYVDLNEELIQRINRLCCPIGFIRHNCFSDNWRGCIPNWLRYNMKFVSSISTVCSPVCNKISNSSVPTVITLSEPMADKFIFDNFGSSWGQPHIDVQNNLFETLCLIPEDSNHLRVRYGTYSTSSEMEVFSKIAKRGAITISKLATICSDAIPKIESHKFSDSFNIIIGETCIDRINFWNFRNLTPNASWAEENSVFLMKASLFNKFEFVKILGNYLNDNNCIDRNVDGHKVALRSLSVEKQKLEDIKNILQEHTHNQVFLPTDYDFPAIPSEKDLIDNNYLPRKNEHTFKISDTINNLEAKDPEHFIYTPAHYSQLHKGQWAIDLKIERHNSFSQDISTIDTWMLPRRRNITRCFTSNLSKVSKNNLLTVIPYSNSYFSFGGINEKLRYTLTLPEDVHFFQYLVQEDLRGVLQQDDMRLIEINKTPYQWRKIKISDKGQNLRGVISMFNSLSDAYECLTNRFWREVLLKYNEKDTFTYYELFETLPHKDEDYKNRVKTNLKLSNKSINRYFHANFKDAIEYLIAKNIFYQVHQWRCNYCGHKNTRTINEIERENKCEICKILYYAPIDLEWEYKLNYFILNSLYKNNGLTVLWALGYLLNRSLENKFYFLPEVNLFYNEDQKEEIDILCVLEGQFIVAEVKKSVLGGFTGITSEDAEKSGNKSNCKNEEKIEDEVKKFIKKINHLKPDVALLVFERYSKCSKNHKIAKQKLANALSRIKKFIPKHIRITVIVAVEEDRKFTEYPIEIPLGYGFRTDKVLDS